MNTLKARLPLREFQKTLSDLNKHTSKEKQFFPSPSLIAKECETLYKTFTSIYKESIKNVLFLLYYKIFLLAPSLQPKLNLKNILRPN